MNFYVSAIDAYMKRAGDNRTISMIFCRDKRQTTVEFALQNLDKSIGVSTYRLSNKLPEAMRDALPSAERLQQEMEIAATELDSDAEVEP